MYRNHLLLVIFILITLFLSNSKAQDSLSVIGPVEYVYNTIDSVFLKAYVFSPSPEKKSKTRPAIAIFHGGGWHIGSPEWTFSQARYFTKKGMVAVGVQYRLSDKNKITPLEAMADARAAIRWMRSNATDLGISTDSIAAFGWSAGAHLAVCSSIFDDSSEVRSVSCIPNALILMSPAVSLEGDKWVQQLLGTKANAKDISPSEHVRKRMPPTIILQGRTDTVTPLPGVQLFTDRMRDAGNRCELEVYDGVGHLFTPSSEPDDGWPNPDPEVQAAAFRKIDKFLLSLGYIK